jgi:hypothetical protein
MTRAERAARLQKMLKNTTRKDHIRNYKHMIERLEARKV